MTRLTTGLKKAALAALATLVVSSCFAEEALAQKRQALVIMRAPTSSASQCDGTTEIGYQLLSDAKLNNKEEVRMAGGLGSAVASTSISRKFYEDSTQKAKLRDLFELKWGDDGVFYAASVESQTPVPVIPDDSKPQKNADQPLSSFYSIMLTGEAREGKTKRQVSVPLRDVQKIYFVLEGTPVGDTLFRHAAEEKSVVLWEAYLRKTNNYRQAEANNYMREALVACSRADLETFRRGEYGSLDKARQRAERAQSVRGDSVTQQLIADIAQSQQKVDAARSTVDAYIRASKFDEAIAAAEPITIYLKTWPTLSEMYNVALKRSYEQHLSSGETALDVGQLDKALSECTLAWKRLPDMPDARTCTCKSRDRVALRDQKNFRLQRRPKDAKELLDARVADGECPRDGEVAKELEGAKCEYAQQLLAESRRLVGGGGGGATVAFLNASAPQRRRGGGRAPQPAAPKPSFVGVKAINAQNKHEFREAREKLVLAANLCQDDAIRTLLTNINRSLSAFCLAEAQKAMQRGDAGTAYVYLTAAQEYTPDDQNVVGILSRAREEFGERTRVSVGVVFDDHSGSRYGQSILNEVTASVESVATAAGLAQPVVLERRQAAQALGAIQSGRAPASPTVIFFGELLAADLRPESPSRWVPSTFYYENPERRRWDRMIDEKKDLYNSCKKQNGEAACSNYPPEIEQMRAHRNAMPRELSESYQYHATSFSVVGGVRLSFRGTDSISRSVQAADTLGATVNYQCEQREQVREGDRSASNSVCNVQSPESYMGDMAGRVMNDARSRAFAQLSALPSSYYKRARTATNQQQAVEDYLRFLFLTREKGGSEAQEAQRALLAYDPELKTDGVLR